MATQTKTTISRKAVDEFITALENEGVTDEKLQEAARYPRAVRLIAKVIDYGDLRGTELTFHADPYCR